MKKYLLISMQTQILRLGAQQGRGVPFAPAKQT
jgi:hypothetical protein